MATEHTKHWKIGNVEVVRIVEVNDHSDPLAMLLQGGTPELMKQHDWVFPHFATPEGDIRISFQAFALKVGGRQIMIDTCIGSDRKRQFDIFTNMQSSFLEDLEAAGYVIDEFDTVLCTHLHFDHVGWNTRLVDGKWVPTFRNARYLFGREEWAHWEHESRDHAHSMHLDDSIQPIFDAGLVDLVENDHKITDEVWLEPTPGHTPGHCSVHISSKGEDAIITGDLMHHPIQMAVPDMRGNFDMNPEVASATRRDFLERYQDRKAMLIGSHFTDPTSGWIERDKDAWKFSVE